MKVIYVGAGSFWLFEAVYQKVKGVTEVIPGYMGGTVAQPNEELVASGTTGHAEVVKITYDEEVISTEDIIKLFFSLHDPSAPNHPEVGLGSQYRATIFYTDESQGEAGDDKNGAAVGVVVRVVATIQSMMPEGVTVSTYVASATEFYPADELHYSYYRHHAEDGYCATFITPKLEAAQKQFPEYF